MNQEQNTRLGVTAALAAFGFWGVAPIYFKWLQAVSPYEIIAHRILWAIPVLLLFLLIRDGRRFISRLKLPLKTIAMLAVSGSLVAFNWLLFVWAVTNDQVLATSLGYFINPLVNVLFGMLFLQERLSRWQLAAVLLAAAGTIYLAWYLGQPPWVALLLAFSFGGYGLMRKRIAAGPMLGLLWETLLLLLPALLWLIYWNGKGNGMFISGGPGLTSLLLASGIVTVLPLIWYNVAAQNLRLSTVGFFQYIAPTISFLLAVYLFGETFTQGHAVAFVCIWLALLIISLEPLLRARRLGLRL